VENEGPAGTDQDVVEIRYPPGHVVNHEPAVLQQRHESPRGSALPPGAQLIVRDPRRWRADQRDEYGDQPAGEHSSEKNPKVLPRGDDQRGIANQRDGSERQKEPSFVTPPSVKIAPILLPCGRSGPHLYSSTLDPRRHQAFGAP